MPLKPHTIRHDATEPDYPWDVLDPDGDVVDSCETEELAREEARARDVEARAEAEEVERMRLCDEIGDKLVDMAIEDVRKVAKRLGVKTGELREVG